MLFDAVEAVWADLDAHFAADMAALVTAKGLTGIDTSATIIKRQTADRIIAKRAVQPTIGIVPASFTTQAKDQGKVDARVWLEICYVATGLDPAAIGEQVELALEAIRKCADRLAGSGGGVFGAAVEPNSIEGELSDYYSEAVAPHYYQIGALTIPVDDRDYV